MSITNDIPFDVENRLYNDNINVEPAENPLWTNQLGTNFFQELNLISNPLDTSLGPHSLPSLPFQNMPPPVDDGNDADTQLMEICFDIPGGDGNTTMDCGLELQGCTPVYQLPPEHNS
jgi:hypothetical protein